MTLALVLPMKDKGSIRSKMNLQATGDEDEGQRHVDNFCQSSHGRLQRSGSQRIATLNKQTPTPPFRGRKGPAQNEMIWTVHDTSVERTPKRSGAHALKFSPPSTSSSPTGSEPESFIDSLLAVNAGNVVLDKPVYEDVLDSPSAAGSCAAAPQRALLRAPSLADINTPPSPPENDSDEGSDDESDGQSFAADSQGESDQEWSDIEEGEGKKMGKEVKQVEVTTGWEVPPQLSRAVTSDGRIEESTSPASRKSITKRLLQKVGSIGKHAGLGWGASSHGRIESSTSPKKSPRFSRKLNKTFEEMDSSSSSDDEAPLIKSRESDMEAPLTPSHADIMLMNHEVFIEELPLAMDGKGSPFGRIQPCLSPASSINSAGYPSLKGTTPPVSERLMKRLAMIDDRSTNGQLRNQSYHGSCSPSISSRSDKHWSTDDFKGGMSSHAKLPSQSVGKKGRDKTRIMRSKSPPPSRNNLSRVGVIDELPLSDSQSSPNEKISASSKDGSKGQAATFLRCPVRVVSGTSAARATTHDDTSLTNEGSLSSLSRLQDCGGSLRSLQESFLVRSTTPTPPTAPSSPFMIQRLKAVAPNAECATPLSGISSHARLQSHNNGSNRSRNLSTRSSKTLPSNGAKEREGSRHMGSADTLRCQSSHGGRSVLASNDRLKLKSRDRNSEFALGTSSHARLQSTSSSAQESGGHSTSRHSFSDKRTTRSEVDLVPLKSQPVTVSQSEARHLSSSRHSTHSKHSFRSLGDRLPPTAPGMSSNQSGSSVHSRQKKTKKVAGANDKKLKDASSAVNIGANVEQELLECLKASRHRRTTTPLPHNRGEEESCELPEVMKPVSNIEMQIDNDWPKPSSTLDFNKSDSDMSTEENKNAEDDMYLQLRLPSPDDHSQEVQEAESDEKDNGDLFVQFCWSTNVQSGNKMTKDRQKYLENYKDSQLPIEQRPLKKAGKAMVDAE